MYGREPDQGEITGGENFGRAPKKLGKKDHETITLPGCSPLLGGYMKQEKRSVETECYVKSERGTKSFVPPRRRPGSCDIRKRPSREVETSEETRTENRISSVYRGKAKGGRLERIDFAK